METWKKVALGSVAGVVLLGLVVWGISAWSHRSKVALLDVESPAPEQIEAIVSLLSVQDGPTLLRVHSRLRQAGEKALPALTKQTTSGSAKVRFDALKLAMEIDVAGGLEAVATLVDPAVTPQAEVRRKAITLLKGEVLTEPRAQELLLKGAKDPDVEVRAFVSEALGKIRTAASFEALKQLAQDKDTYTARHASRRMRELGRRR